MRAEKIKKIKIAWCAQKRKIAFCYLADTILHASPVHKLLNHVLCAYARFRIELKCLYDFTY